MRTPAEIEAEAQRLEAAPSWRYLRHAAAHALRDRLSPGQVQTMGPVADDDEGEYEARMHAARWAWGLEDEPPSVWLS